MARRTGSGALEWVVELVVNVRRYSTFVDALGMGALAFPIMTGRQREVAIELSSAVTVGDARALMRGKSTPGIEKLREAFNTERRRHQLSEALVRFDWQIEQWHEAGRDRRLAWIVPGELWSADPDLIDLPPELWGRLLSTAPASRLAAECKDAALWLGYLSLELIGEVQRMRAGDDALCNLMLRKAARSVGLKGSARPWEPPYSRKLAALPTSFLFQFEPLQRAASVLERLARGGVTNVGHMVVMHPEAWRTMRRCDERRWRELARALKGL